MEEVPGRVGGQSRRRRPSREGGDGGEEEVTILQEERAASADCSSRAGPAGGSRAVCSGYVLELGLKVSAESTVMSSKLIIFKP